MIMMNHPYSSFPFVAPSNQAPELETQSSTSSTSAPLSSKFQVSVPVAVMDNFARTAPSDLAAGCEPLPRDVVCGRGKGSYNRPGNVAFRKVIRMYIKDYMSARTKFEKTTVLNAVIDRLHTEEQARFLKFNSRTKQWFEITDDQAREKVGHTMRETIASLDSVQPDEQTRSDLMASQKAIFEAMLQSSSKPTSPSRTKTSVAVTPPPAASYRMPWDDDDDVQSAVHRAEV
jgi:hypothetical protein